MKVPALILLLLAMVCPAFAFDPPALDKTDARHILEAMDWCEVTVLAVRQGVDDKGMAAPIFATVIGLGKLRNEHRSICQTLYFDKDLGWYALEVGNKSARLWNRNGFQAIKPWGTW